MMDGARPDDTLYDRACRVSPGGAQTLSKRHDRYGAGMPPFLWSGHGVHVYGEPTDDWNHPHCWLDWIASLAAVTLGHAHPAVTEAMTRQLKDGGTFAMPHPLEVRVGQEFLATTGWPDGMVRWCSTGSECTEAAMRTARIATGRDRILSIGYHGWHSVHTAAKPVRPGVPAAFAAVIRDLPAGQIDAVRDMLDATVAALILEPCADAPPDVAYLQAVADLVHQQGALVIADEIICGFRWSEQGAMLGTCGVRPDLACYGKAIANGAFPIAALVGSADLMQHAWPVSGTANGHPVGLAAVEAVLDVYAREQPLRALHQAGRTLRHGLMGLALAIPRAHLVVGGDDPRPVARIRAPRLGGLIGQIVEGRAWPIPTEIDEARSNIGQTLLCQELARRGVLWHPAGAGNAMVGHGPHVAETLDAFAGALAVVAEALATEHPETWLAGAPSSLAVAVR